MSAPFGWLAAHDDMLTERHRNCMACGRLATQLDLRVINNVAWAVSMCRACLALDPTWDKLDARLALRAREGEAC